MNIALFIISLAVLCFSAYTDIKDGTVRNEVVLPAIGLGLILQLIRVFIGQLTFGDYLIRIILIIATFFFYEGFIGGGDAKLFMMLIILQGPYKALATIGIASLMVVAYTFYKNPKEATESAKAQIMAILTKTVSNIKNQGETIKFSPLMLAGLIIVALVFGV